MRRELLLVLLVEGGLSGCGGLVGNGSEIGPAVPEFPKHTFSGQVLASGANWIPVVGASVRLDEAAVNNAAVTDEHGRFRIEEPPLGSFTLTIDGRTGAANSVGQSFPKYQLRVAVSGEGSLPIPVFLPNLTPPPGLAGSKTVAVGSTLAAADNIAIAGAGATLVLAGAKAEWANPPAHAGETTVQLTAAVVPTEEIPFPLVSLADGLLSSPLVLWIEPSDLLFTPAAGLILTSAFYPEGASTVGLYRHDLGGSDWVKEGAAGVAGGVVTASALLSQGGFAALAAPCGSSTTVAGRVLDGSGNPLVGALVTANSGKSALSATDGTFSIPGVCATDGNGAAQTVSAVITASTALASIVTKKTATMVAGGTTSLGDLTLNTVSSGRVELLLVRKGLAVSDQEVAIGSDKAGYGARAKTDAQGLVNFFDVPIPSSGLYQGISAAADSSLNPPGIHAGGLFFAFGGLFAASLFLDTKPTFTFTTIDDTLVVTVVREDSEAPIENAFVMAGLDPNTAPQGFTNAAGQIVLNVSPPVSVTAGVQTTAPAGGGGFDLVRKTAYQTVEGVNTLSLVIRLPVAQRLEAIPQPFKPFGKVSGSASGLTNPTVAPPANGSGTYAVDLHTNPAADARQIFPVFNERSDYEALTPAGTDAAIGYTAGGVLDSAFTLAGNAPTCFLVGVERDSVSATSGTVKRFGLSSPINVNPGATAAGSLSLDFAQGPASLSLAAGGLDSGLSGALKATLAAELSTGKGAKLGDWTSHLSFDGTAGTGTLAVPALSGILGGGVYRVSLSAESAAVGGNLGGTIVRSQAAYLRGSSSLAANFLSVPTFSTPTPDGTDFDPTGAGVVFAADAGSSVHRIRLTRPPTTVSGVTTIRDDFDWAVFTAGGDNTVVFPVLPATSQGIAVPSFFSSGQTYTVEVRSLAASLFSYQAFFANASRIRLSELSPTAESLYRADAKLP